jgi:hypothetical protein
MRPGSDAQTPSVFEVVRRAVAVCDPDGDDERIAELLLAYEDRDEPVTALGDRDRTFFETAERIAGALPAPGLELAAAVATYLAFRRDEVAGDEDLLRLAARAEYGDELPPDVAAWLADAGIAV